MITHPPTPKAVTDKFCCAPIFFCHTFCGCVANTKQHIIFSIEISVFLSGQMKKIKSCPNANTATKRHFTPTATTVPFTPEKKWGKLFNIKSLPLWYKSNDILLILSGIALVP